MNRTYIYFSKTKVFLEILSEIGFKYIYNPYIIIFNFKFLLGKKMLEGNGIRLYS